MAAGPTLTGHPLPSSQPQLRLKNTPNPSGFSKPRSSPPLPAFPHLLHFGFFQKLIEDIQRVQAAVAHS